jgi:hypothetical protein
MPDKLLKMFLRQQASMIEDDTSVFLQTIKDKARKPKSILLPKRKVAVIMGCMLFVLGLGGVGYATNAFPFFKIPINEEQRQAQKEIELQLAEQQNMIDEDIVESLPVNMKGFKQIDMVERRRTLDHDPLTSIYGAILGAQEVGSFKPSVYLHEDHKRGYVFVKHSDGSNHVYFLELDQEGRWVITDIRSGKGRVIKPIQ